MKTIINAGIILIALSMTGCSTSKVSELDARVSRLEKNPPALDEITQAVVDVMIGGPSSSPNLPSKSDAVLALALFQRTETTSAIIQQAQASKDRHFRMQCFNALGWLGDRQAIPCLENAMLNDEYNHSRKAAAVALEAITGDKYLTPENGFESK